MIPANEALQPTALPAVAGKVPSAGYARCGGGFGVSPRGGSGVILAAEIEQRRTAQELKEFVQMVRDRVEPYPDEMRRARSCEGLYREFVNEVIPLSQFAHLLYPAGTSFLPVLGNQGYDVEVFDGQGTPLDRIEIAKPHDGKAEAEANRLVNERGFGQTRVCDFGGQLEALAPWIADSAQNKSLKEYGDCTLVLVVGTDPPFEEELEVLECRAIKITQNLNRMVFRAKRAFLTVPSLGKCFPIGG